MHSRCVEQCRISGPPPCANAHRGRCFCIQPLVAPPISCIGTYPLLQVSHSTPEDLAAESKFAYRLAEPHAELRSGLGEFRNPRGVETEASRCGSSRVVLVERLYGRAIELATWACFPVRRQRRGTGGTPVHGDHRRQHGALPSILAHRLLDGERRHSSFDAGQHTPFGLSRTVGRLQAPPLASKALAWWRVTPAAFGRGSLPSRRSLERGARGRPQVYLLPILWARETPFPVREE